MLKVRQNNRMDKRKHRINNKVIIKSQLPRKNLLHIKNQLLPKTIKANKRNQYLLNLQQPKKMLMIKTSLPTIKIKQFIKKTSPMENLQQLTIKLTKISILQPLEPKENQEQKNQLLPLQTQSLTKLYREEPRPKQRKAQNKIKLNQQKRLSRHQTKSRKMEHNRHKHKLWRWQRRVKTSQMNKKRSLHLCNLKSKLHESNNDQYYSSDVVLILNNQQS